MLVDAAIAWLIHLRWSSALAQLVAGAGGLVTLVFCAWLANVVAKRVILRLVGTLIQRSPFAWDDVLLRAGVFTRLSHVAPALVVASFGRELVAPGAWGAAIGTAVNVYLVVILLLVIDALLDAGVELYNLRASARRMPLRGFAQGAKLVSFLLGGVLITSLMLGRSPALLLSGLGALTAVLLLVFKDALLGLVAGVQISVNRMVQVGDWIEMDKYGADGDVIDVGLTTVKVQNWDKTITTVPTYALISDPVKNWRGMQESGGRRIKRALYLDVQSFRFVDPALLDKLMQYNRLRPYLEQKLSEIAAWNEQRGEDLSVLANGRRLSNVGCFRAYALAYLRDHALIHKEMTLMVRQLEPSDKGLPIELYAFTSDTDWAVYEGIQADIFDHLLTVVPEFELRVFQSPSGHDLRSIGRPARAGGAPTRDRASPGAAQLEPGRTAPIQKAVRRSIE